MRKVGIITVFDVENYGNRLQAYALSKALSTLQYDTAETHYCPTFTSMIKGHIKKNRILRTAHYALTAIAHREKDIFQKCKRLGLFFDFLKYNRVQLLRRDDPSISRYVCGSDQIWNPTLAGTPYYFAAFAKNEKRISYAASFGLSTLPEDVAKAYTPHLSNMAHLSVREYAGAEIIKELTGREASVVLDPTLLLDKQDWQAITKRPRFPIKGKYLLTYFLSWYSEETRMFIERTAKENDLEIITLNNFDKNNFWYQTGPAEFVWLIENASLVCTDSFHATVFSIIMNSPFVVFKRDLKKNDMHSRIETLLGTFELENREFTKLQQGEEFCISFDHIPSRLAAERQHSLDYLLHALQE